MAKTTTLNNGQKAAAMRSVCLKYAAELKDGDVLKTVLEISDLPSASLARLYDAISSYKQEA